MINSEKSNIKISVPNVSPPRLPQLCITFAEPIFLLGRQNQLSVQGFCGDFVCLSMFAQRFGHDLFSPFGTDSKRLETTVSRSMSAQVSLMPVRLATEPYSAISLLELVPNEPCLNKVGTVLAAMCCLLLDALECRGELRSLEAALFCFD